MLTNTLPFVLQILQHFDQIQIPVWLFGGWAEEIWGMSAPRSHHDIDLLYVSHTFDTLDQHIVNTPTCIEIRAKRFSHKRAIVYQDVMIELLLIEPGFDGYRSHFFTDLYELHWPSDVLDYKIPIQTTVVSVASKAALHLYRQNHSYIEAAYHWYNENTH